MDLNANHANTFCLTMQEVVVEDNFRIDTPAIENFSPGPHPHHGLTLAVRLTVRTVPAAPEAHRYMAVSPGRGGRVEHSAAG